MGKKKQGAGKMTNEIKKIMTEQKEKKYSGYGYHGGGRKATGIKRVSICISGQPEQIEKLKQQAAAKKMTVSAYIFQLANINKAEEMERQRIANYDFERGDVKY